MAKMNYSIPWDFLPDDDAEFFDRAQIEREPSFLKFKRDLTREEVSSLCVRLWNFRAIIPDSEDNHSNFAIGQAFNEFSRLFGEIEGKRFIKEWFRLATIRDTALKVTGGALIYLQSVEHQIKGCCSMLDLKGLNLSLDDFQSTDTSRRRQTLGQLKSALMGTSTFSADFEAHFNRFVTDRNEFVHTLWTKDSELDERSGLPSEAYYNEKFRFTVSIFRQAHHMEAVFRGMLGAIFESLTEQLKDHEAVGLWRRYIPKYNATLRNQRNGVGVQPPPGNA